MNNDSGALLLFCGGALALAVGIPLAIGGVIGALCGHPRGGLVCAVIGAALAAAGAKAWGWL